MFYYPAKDSDFDVVEISNKLKKSMSHVLTRYYPLAGRLNENNINATYIDCNDEGVSYLEARVKSQLNNLIPFESDKVTDLALGVQLNIFECGAVAIGSCISHKIADGLSSFMFLKSWGAATAGGDVDDHDMKWGPQVEAAVLFPPKNIISGFDRVGITNKNIIISKRFVFDACIIEHLKEKYAIIHGKGSSNHENEKSPSRVEALSAFIWSRFKAATIQLDHNERLYAMVHAVNLRTRIEPPLPEYCSFGNLYRFVTVIPCFNTGEEENCGIVNEMREQISRVDQEYVKMLQQGREHLDFIMEQISSKETIFLSFSSLCRFPLYESDFGWGKPVWVGLPPLTFNNLVVLMDTSSGDGIEVCINLHENDMAKLENDDEFQAFVSPKDMLS